MPPRKIVITTYGSLGDIHPYLPIALELQQRGHRVVLATSLLYQAKIEALGLEFHATRPDLPDVEKAPEVVAQVMKLRTGSEYLVKKLLMPALRDSFADLAHATRDADVLLTHPATLAGPLVARKNNVPWISTILAPFFVTSVYDPPTPPIIPQAAFLYRFGPSAARMLFAVMRLVTNQWFRPYYRFQRELGLPDTGNPFFQALHSPDLVLALFSEVLASRQSDWPTQTVVTGFPFYDALGEIGWKNTTSKLSSGDASFKQASRLSPELEAFLQADEPPLVFTLGSSAVMDAGRFYEHSSEAARRLNKRAVLLAGRSENLPANLPEDVVAFDYAPHSALFPRALAIVHQGGVGTTGQALRSGRPQLVMPYSHDQPDHAARIVKLGVGRQISRSRYTPARAAHELSLLLNEPSYAQRAAEVGERVRAENGAVKAADEIEKFLRARA
jgi:UDP:flavonoid glycosyltransferase YjiC (YdhE family)